MPDTLWHLAGWAIALLGAPLLARALLADRAKGRRRCPKCWYSMDGVPATPPDAAHPSANPTYLCPECGHTARSEKALLKTRRRLNLLPLTLVAILLGYTLWTIPRIQREGSLGLIPTTYLILTVPYPETDFFAARTQRDTKLQDTLRNRVSDPAHRLPPQLVGWQMYLWDWSLRLRFSGRTCSARTNLELISKLDAAQVHLPTFRVHNSQLLYVRDVAARIQQYSSIPVHVNDVGDKAVTMEGPPTSASRTLDLLCNSLYNSVVWNITPNGIDIVRREDAPPSLISSYDVESIVDARYMGECRCDITQSPTRCGCIYGWRDNSAELIDVLTSLIYPDDWVNNGGDLAYASVVGPRLFVVAQSAAHARIAQLIDAMHEAKRTGRSRLPSILGPLLPQSLDQDLPVTVVYRMDAPATTSSTARFQTYHRTLVTSVHPDIWYENGGNGGCTATVGDLLIVVAPESAHAQILESLNQLKLDSKP